MLLPYKLAYLIPYYQTDARIQAVSETMNIIRMIKLFGWETRMEECLRGTRESELRLVWKIKYLNCFYVIIGYVHRSPFIFSS